MEREKIIYWLVWFQTHPERYETNLPGLILFADIHSLSTYFKGRHQCKLAGQILDKFNLKIDQAYTSELSRSQDSVEEILRELDQKETVKVQKSWRMNERHYGALTGTPKNTTHFQRSFYVAPEPMSSTHPYWQSIAGHPAYAELVAAGTLPRTESLQDAYDRMIPYWNSTILPQILAGQIILISSHSNTIRSHIKHLDHLDGLDAAVIALKNCVPIIYEFDKNMRVVVSKKYLEWSRDSIKWINF